MAQTAVFVDAGYLHAQGSALLAGQKQPRNQIILDVEKTLHHLRSLCATCAPNERLLRVYWYDGLQRTGRMSSEQEQVAGAQYAKLRLGVINSQGDQKGVDSLIVTDLIDLARNRAITNAVLVSGDEDIRIGVQIAQTFGIQIHLLGVKPARGSQSPDLIREADTHHEWDESVIREIMKIRQPTEEILLSATAVIGNPSPDSASFEANVKRSVEDTLDTIDQAILDDAIRAFKVNSSSVPPELDRPTLGRLRSLLGRDLSDDERKDYRRMFRLELATI